MIISVRCANTESQILNRFRRLAGLPKTGEERNLLLEGMGMIAAGALIVLTMLDKKRKKEN